jgi:hypothetical protein
VKSDKEYRERHGDDPDEIVAKHITTSSDEEKYLVKAEVREVKSKKATPGESHHHLLIAADTFHGIYGDMFNPELDLSAEDITILIEVPARKFQRECQAAVENSNGFFVKLQGGEVEDEVTQFVPEVVVIDEEDEDE